MNNRDKVIKGLKCCMEGVKKCRECPYYPIEIECLETLTEDALELLKDQEATKPVSTIIQTAMRINLEWKCGNCNHALRMREDIYCPHCGQKVKWDGND